MHITPALDKWHYSLCSRRDFFQDKEMWELIWRIWRQLREMSSIIHYLISFTVSSTEFSFSNKIIRLKKWTFKALKSWKEKGSVLLCRFACHKVRPDMPPHSSALYFKVHLTVSFLFHWVQGSLLFFKVRDRSVNLLCSALGERRSVLFPTYLETTLLPVCPIPLGNLTVLETSPLNAS